MPYVTERNLRKLEARLQNTYPWIKRGGVAMAAKVFNSALDQYGDEGRAYATMYAALNKAGYKKAAPDSFGSRYWYPCADRAEFAPPAEDHSLDAGFG